MNIVLIGFASCGKSATAYELARRLAMKFVDLDKEIEVRYYLLHGRELHYREIIRREGDEVFFELEHLVLRECLQFSDCVIAPGGGAPMREENREVLQKLGTVYYIRTEPSVILQRMQAKGPPLFLNGVADLERLTEVWHERDVVYRALASHIIDNSALSVAQTADAVEALLPRSGS